MKVIPRLQQYDSYNDDKGDYKYKYYLIPLTQFQGQDSEEISVGPEGFR
jgi:hypothetical protein